MFVFSFFVVFQSCRKILSTVFISKIVISASMGFVLYLTKIELSNVSVLGRKKFLILFFDLGFLYKGSFKSNILKILYF